MKKPYQFSVQEIQTQYTTDVELGLSTQEAKRRLSEYGLNDLPDVEHKTILSIFLSQFTSPLIYILIAAAVILFIFGTDKLDPFIITGILFFNAIIGTIQEGRTYSIIQSLKRLLKSRCMVIRDGTQHIVDDTQIVVGDLIVLHAGERIPADARIVQSYQLTLDEAMLTGESTPVVKQTDVLQPSNLSVGDQINMVFKGTYILSGTGKAIVVAIGTATQVGLIHKAVQDIKTEIPLKQELKRLSWFILLFIVFVCLFMFILGTLFGRSFHELIIVLTALFICVIPEGLPVVLTLVLVMGAYSLAKLKVLAKNLQAVEGLGRTEVILTDKTGTLTRNEMMVSEVFTAQGLYHVTGVGYYTQGTITQQDKPIDSSLDKDLTWMGIVGFLLNKTKVVYQQQQGTFDIEGDPTQAAIGILGHKLGGATNKDSFKELYEIPFDSLRRFQAGFYQHNGTIYGFVMGAPEVIMKNSNYPETIQQGLHTLLEKGLRVVAVGMFTIDHQADIKEFQQVEHIMKNKIQILGLCGIQDAIRPEVAHSIKQARQAGLHIAMLTGDHKQTAVFVAKEVGIFKKHDQAIDGTQLDKLTDEQLLHSLEQITVFARLNPHHKVRIVELFHAKNKIVAMTGDGVNDVPSLVAADVGIAMGGIGTEVAKQAADLVLLDDSFVHIINGIKEGRHIFYTLRRVVLYFFSTNFSEILVVLFALCTSLPLPLLPAQILWLNFVTDGFLDIGLSFEPQEEGLLNAHWLSKKFTLVDKYVLGKMIFMAVPMAIGFLLVFYWYYSLQISLPYARTVGLLTLVMYQWFNAWNCRSERLSILQIGIFTNRWLLAAALFVLMLQFLLVYVTWFNMVFKTVPIGIYDWMIIFAMTFPIIIMEEMRKYIARRHGSNLVD